MLTLTDFKLWFSVHGENVGGDLVIRMAALVARLRTPDLNGKLGGRFLGVLASDQGVNYSVPS